MRTPKAFSLLLRVVSLAPRDVEEGRKPPPEFKSLGFYSRPALVAL